MPRLMSVALTEQAVRERRKTVTRRLGWQFLKPGDRLTLCRKVMVGDNEPLRSPLAADQLRRRQMPRVEITYGEVSDE